MPIPDSQLIKDCSLNPLWLEIAKITVPALLAGLMSAYLGTHFALKKFTKEKQWEKKQDAYKQVIDAFEEIKYWAEEVCAEHCCMVTNSTPTNKDEALRTLRKFSEVGALYFSHEFLAVLQSAHGEILQISEVINEQSMGNMHDPNEMSRWCFTEAGKIKTIIDSNLPKLIALYQDKAPVKRFDFVARIIRRRRAKRLSQLGGKAPEMANVHRRRPDTD